MSDSLNNKNNILVKTDQNNLIYIDPNSVVYNNEVKGRTVSQEDLVMYVNLEADLIPRTTMIIGNKENPLTSIAKGTFNLLHNNNGKDLDTSWTESYVPSSKVYDEKGNIKSDQMGKFNDDSGQSFGIDNISIKITGTNFIPNVTIKFIDVRGKTLFDSPENSPYKAFFHIPWPIFYLTIKGFYGKAIRYRLHLVKFNTRYNASNGNFEIDTTFVGSTYAYLNDIPLKGILNAPYMYGIENDEKTTFNGHTGMVQKKIKSTSRGYQTLLSVYNEYKNKGLIDKNFPPKTLRDISIAAGRLDKILEKELFSKIVDPGVLAGISEYEKTILDFEQYVNVWKGKYLSAEQISDTQFNKLKDKNKSNLNDIIGSDQSTLESVLKKYIEKLYNNMAFGKSPNKNFGKSEVTNNLSTISLSSLQNINDFILVRGGFVGVNIDDMLSKISDIQRIFIEKRKSIENVIEQEMNNIISGKNKGNNYGLGFEPTIRNIVAVILANADTYIRLLKNVHESAFDVSDTRKSFIDNFNTDANKNDNIYPWPEIKKQSEDGKINVLTYPGAFDVQKKLKSYSSLLWPEVDFVENFLQVSTYKNDPLVDKETDPDRIEYIFDSNSETTKIGDVNLFSSLGTYIPYVNKSFSSLIYEIYERAKYSMSIVPYDNQSILALANIEADNILKTIKDDTDIIRLLKNNITKPKYNGVNDKDSIVYNLFNCLAQTSLYERYPYFQSQQPTTDYLKNLNQNDFSVNTLTATTKDYVTYPEVDSFLNKYEDYVEDYRTKIYPYNSPKYLSYTSKSKFIKDDLKFGGGILSTNKGNGSFISSVIDPMMWVDNYKTNLFANTLDLGDNNRVSILNTPYFHKQLYDDYVNVGTYGKYTGSAYLLLNSLPFIELDSKIKYNETYTLASTLFREVSAVHKIPYHLMIKWGSIYHRYKTYLNDGYDIIGDVKTPIDVKLFYDYTSTGRTYSGNTNNVQWVVDIDDHDVVGFFPFYQDVFHNIVNDYTFFNYVGGTGSTQTFTDSVVSGVTKSNMVSHSLKSNLRTYTSYVDNSYFNVNGSVVKNYTLLPSNGNRTISGLTYNTEIQDSFRILWGVENEFRNIVPSYSGYTFPAYNEYHIGESGLTYSLDENYKKVVDLIATFKSDILDVFESAFLDFASQKLNTEIQTKSYNVTYDKFQDLLSDMVKVDKTPNDSINVNDNITSIIKKQNQKLKDITKTILSNHNLVNIALANPREIDDSVIGSFTEQSEIITNFGRYESSQLNAETEKYIKLYLGDYIDNGTNYYQTFFNDNNIALTIDNIRLFRPLVQVYAGFKTSGGITSEFKTYVKNNINSGTTIYISDNNNKSVEFGKIETKLMFFLNQVFKKINDEPEKNNNQTLNIKRSYNDDVVKLELYNFFKSFNDKWVAGNSLGQRTLMEEFLFLDKSNKDIGSSVYIDMTKLIPILDMKNRDLNLYSVLVLLLENTGFDIRTLPAYVNFYGTNFSNTTKIKPSKDVAKNIFGTFLDVDCEESSPKIILQYFGNTSKHLEMSDVDRKIKFKGDGFNAADTNNNPIIVAPDVFRNTDFSKSNRAVVFEVSVGDQQQSMFKSVELDQSTIKNTSESFDVIERLGSSAAGSQTSQIDIGLFDIYRQASYQCTVNSLGNVMVQPTMFFYLKNIPMFRGTYWITEVTHTIKSSGIDTSFTGSRIPATSLPDPKDSFMASYRAIFDRMVRKSLAKVKSDENKGGTEKTIMTENGYSTYVISGETINGESVVNDAQVKPYGIPYNGFGGEKYILLVDYKDVRPNGSNNNGQWLRAQALLMGSETSKLSDEKVMSIVSGLDGYSPVTWGDIKLSGQKFYSSKFLYSFKPNDIMSNHTETIFLNPRTGKQQKLKTDINQLTQKYQGPINVGPAIEGYGIALSPTLMSNLGLKEGDVVYFKLQ